MTTERYLFDVNVLFALSWSKHVHHARAQNWFSERTPDWASTPITEAGLVRLMINRAIMGSEVPVARALETLDALRSEPGHSFVPDDSTLAAPVIALTRLASRHAVTDLHLANLAAKHGLRLATLDARLPELLEPADRGVVLVLP